MKKIILFITAIVPLVSCDPDKVFKRELEERTAVVEGQATVEGQSDFTEKV